MGSDEDCFTLEGVQCRWSTSLSTSGHEVLHAIHGGQAIRPEVYNQMFNTPWIA